MRLFGYISAVLLVAVSPSHAAERYVCPDGSSKAVSSFDDCPKGEKLSALAAMKKRDVRILGLSDKPITGSFKRLKDTGINRYISDEFATSISLDLKESGSEFSKISITHGDTDKAVWLHISGPSSPDDRETVSRYRATRDSIDRYQIYKPDGTFLAFEACLMTEVLEEGRASLNLDIEFETSCKKSD